MTERAVLPERVREIRAMKGGERYADVEALAFAIVRALEDRDSGLLAEVRALRQDVSALCEEVANLNHALVQQESRRPAVEANVNTIRTALRVEIAPLHQQISVLDHTSELAALRSHIAELGQRLDSVEPVALSATLQDTIRSDLARLIERLNAQSRADQVVALREEVRAQLGGLDQAGELRELRTMVTTELTRLREQAAAAASWNVPAAPSNGHENGQASPERVAPYGSGTGRRRRRRRRTGNIDLNERQT